MRFLRTWNKEQEAKEKGSELERRIDEVWIQFAIWVPRPRHLSHKRIGLIGVSPSIKMACLQLVNLYSLRSHPPSVVTVWPGQGCQPAWSYLILNLSNLSALLFFCVWIRPSAHHASAEASVSNCLGQRSLWNKVNATLCCTGDEKMLTGDHNSMLFFPL